MADQEEIYKGKKITIRAEQGFPQLWIDGKPVPFKRSSDGKNFSSNRSPFIKFGSLQELAKKLIDERLA